MRLKESAKKFLKPQRKYDTPAFLRENVFKFIQALLPDYDNPAAVRADLSNTSQQKLYGYFCAASDLYRAKRQVYTGHLQRISTKRD